MINYDFHVDVDSEHSLYIRSGGPCPFYARMDCTSIAQLLVMTGKTAWLGEEIKITRQEINDRSAQANAHVLVSEIKRAWDVMYAGKRGRKPNIQVDVVDNDGRVVRSVTP